MEEKKNNAKQKASLLIDALSAITKKKGISQYEIARRSGLEQSNISRVFSKKYSPRIDIFLLIAEAVGVSIEIFDKDGDSPSFKIK